MSFFIPLTDAEGMAVGTARFDQLNVIWGPTRERRIHDNIGFMRFTAVADQPLSKEVTGSTEYTEPRFPRSGQIQTSIYETQVSSITLLSSKALPRCRIQGIRVELRPLYRNEGMILGVGVAASRTGAYEQVLQQRAHRIRQRQAVLAGALTGGAAGLLSARVINRRERRDGTPGPFDARRPEGDAARLDRETTGPDPDTAGRDEEAVKEKAELAGRVGKAVSRIEKNVVVFLEGDLFSPEEAAALADPADARMTWLGMEMRKALPWPDGREMELQVVVVSDGNREALGRLYKGWNVLEVARKAGTDARPLPLGAVPRVVARALAEAEEQANGTFLLELDVAPYLNLEGWKLEDGLKRLLHDLST